MPDDESKFVHGRVYHGLFDPPLAECRKVVTDLVPEGSSVLDIACGTGELCFGLREAKHCRVVGVDLSLRQLDFAQRSNRFDDVQFHHMDASNLASFGPRAFDYATVMLLMHELPRKTRLKVLAEAFRVASTVVMVDGRAPLPWNIHGLALRIVEASAGPRDYDLFREFLAGGGIRGLLKDSPLQITILHHSVFWHNCREVIVLSGPENNNQPEKSRQK
jgi:SAM-dependent methyltransferase